MDGSLHLAPLIRLLALNTQVHELRTELSRQSVASVRIAELQESIDRCQRSSLTTFWLSEGFELEAEEDDLEGLAGTS
jgi:hypothetical protein